MSKEHSTWRASRIAIAALLVGTLVAAGLGVQAAVAALGGNADPKGDVTELGGGPAPVDITGVEVTYTATELTVVTTIVDGEGMLGQVDTLIDTDGDPAAEFAQRYRTPASVTETATTTWDDFFYGEVACALQTDVQHTKGTIVLTATTERSCLGNPDQVRVWTWAAGIAPYSTWRDASAGSPPLERYEFDWSEPVAADQGTGQPTDPPTDPPTVDPTPTKAATATGLRIPRRTVVAGHAVRLRVALTSSEGFPNGVVVIKNGRTALRQITMLTNAQWSRVTRLRPGVYRLRAVYAGNEDYLGSASKAIRVVVERR